MAVNLLTITKEANDYFTFVLNGDIANAIKNTRNDLTMVGDFAHIKSSEGANFIKEQNIIYSNITIVDGIALPSPISADDLFAKLFSVGYFDWINGSGSGGVDRFDELLDTFDYFGKDGQVPRVNESQLKLEAFVLPDASYLNYFPDPLVANKMLKVKADGTAYEFVDPPAGNNGNDQEFEYTSGSPIFFLASSSKLTAVACNGIIMRRNDWTQVLDSLTINYPPNAGDIFQPIGII